MVHTFTIAKSRKKKTNLFLKLHIHIHINSQALSWHSAYNIPTLLRQNGIMQNTKESLDTVLSVLSKVTWNKKVAIVCSSSYVEELQFCFDWNGDATDCPVSSYQKTDFYAQNIYNHTNQIQSEGCPSEIIFSA